MSFDEEHLDEHWECRREIERLQALVDRLLKAAAEYGKALEVIGGAVE